MQKNKENTSKKYCLNCQTELQGKYCHVCGQQASQQKPTVKEFILEYLNIAFVWDTHFIKTLKLLLRKPGQLTNEYVSGKFVSYMHPLKLNMFLLFTFITLFLLFHKAEKLDQSLYSITRDEAMFPLIQLEMMKKDTNYVKALESSQLDTVQIYAPLILSEVYPEFISNTDTTYVDTSVDPSDSMAIWTAVLPHKLIEDKALLRHADGHYYFNLDYKVDLMGPDFLEKIWSKMVKLTTTYFPMIILLTAPFLSFLVRLLQRKSKYPQFNHFIFSLHYTAILELIMIIFYIIHLIVSPPTWLMQWILIVASCSYLTLAIRRVYGTKRWPVALGQALVLNLGYVMILSAIFMCIFFISIVLVATHLI